MCAKNCCNISKEWTGKCISGMSPTTRVSQMFLAKGTSNMQSVSQRWVCFDNVTCCHAETGGRSNLSYLVIVIFTPGVALTFEKLRIANAQHGKNCVSSPAAKTTISTDLPKICPGHDHAGLQTAHRPFWLRHQQYVGTSIPSPGWGGGNLRCLDPRQVLYKPSLVGAKNEKTKRILMWGHCFLCTVNAWHFQICVACSFFA